MSSPDYRKGYKQYIEKKKEGLGFHELPLLYIDWNVLSQEERQEMERKLQ